MKYLLIGLLAGGLAACATIGVDTAEPQIACQQVDSTSQHRYYLCVEPIAGAPAVQEQPVKPKFVPKWEWEI